MMPPPVLGLTFDTSVLSPLVPWLPVLGVALITLGVMMRLRHRRKRVSGQPTAREQLERAKQTRAMKTDLEELMVEIERLTRRFASQIDAKTAELETLLREADERIGELRRHHGQIPPPPRARAASDPYADATDTADPLSRSVFDLADEGLPPVEIARKLNEHVGKVELILALRKTQ